jgi:hypothetical protein
MFGYTRLTWGERGERIEDRGAFLIPVAHSYFFFSSFLSILRATYAVIHPEIFLEFKDPVVVKEMIILAGQQSVQSTTYSVKARTTHK